MSSKIWINGKFVDSGKARISVFDRGFLYGDGIFETMRSYAGIVFRLNQHLTRFFNSLKIIRMRLPYKERDLINIIYKVLKKNNLKSAYLRLTMTRGEGLFGMAGPRLAPSPNLVIFANKFEGYPEWMQDRGIHACMVNIRQNESSPLSRMKSLSFMNCILARLSAAEKGYDEAILTNTKGHVTEASTSNIFLVKKSNIITPSLESGILPGITRGIVIRIADRLKLRISQRAVLPGELMDSDEIFLTNSLAEVLPVVSVNSKRIGNGKPGDITKLLHISYQKEVIREVLSK